MEKEDIKKEFEEWNNGLFAGFSDMTDWWLAKLEEQKQQMIEKVEGLKRKEGEDCLTTDDESYNQAITDYQNLINK